MQENSITGQQRDNKDFGLVINVLELILPIQLEYTWSIMRIQNAIYKTRIEKLYDKLCLGEITLCEYINFLKNK